MWLTMSTIEKAVEKLAVKEPAEGKSSVPETSAISVSGSVSSRKGPPLGYSAGLPREAACDLPPDIILPFSRLDEMGFVSPEKPRSSIAEEYRAIKRPLLKNIDGNVADEAENANLIMVTSSFEGEGKTFSAINLMLSISLEKNKTVLFVDADIAKSSAGRLLGIPDNKLGLVDLLERDDLGVEDVLLRTNLPNVRIIPAGIPHERSTELLASERMHLLMAELSLRYSDRVIIFDSPPFLQTSEAGVLAGFMGQVMFVVEAEKTAPEMVKQAVSQISDDKIIGLVLNKARKYPWDQYTHGYGYGYGYGYGSDRTRAGGV